MHHYENFVGVFHEIRTSQNQQALGVFMINIIFKPTFSLIFPLSKNVWFAMLNIYADPFIEVSIEHPCFSETFASYKFLCNILGC